MLTVLNCMDKIWFCEGETLINYRSQLLAEPASSVVGIIARAWVTFVLASWSFTSSQPASKSLNKKLENLQLRSGGWGTRWQQVAWLKYFSLQEINFASRGFLGFLYGRFASRVAPEEARKSIFQFWRWILQPRPCCCPTQLSSITHLWLYAPNQPALWDGSQE